jgi:hypothetical protein
MRRHEFGLEYKVKLTTQVSEAILDFNNIHKVSTRRGLADDQPLFLEDFHIFIVEFKAMTMSFGDILAGIGSRSGFCRIWSGLSIFP